jgi:N-ethylmaleimide reductase
MIMTKLFNPVRIGAYTLSHRVALAPMTRLRTTQPGDVPSAMMADFYGQRASEGGLEIVEAASVSVRARSYLGAASIYHDGQMEGWKAITQAVHAKGGRVFLQLIHGGRQSARNAAVDSSNRFRRIFAAKARTTFAPFS